jgi:hypothetical protein
MVNKERLILYIVMEAIITGAMLYELNYWAASGWGFLMLTNIHLLLEQINIDKK